jgi:hypothetical protein
VNSTLTDTHPDAHRVQVELFRRAGPARRLQVALDLSDETYTFARRAIERANPGVSQREVDLIFARVHYGKDIERRLRAFFQATAA